ncbi:MAG: S41 family peptidase [Bacteroidales bacterium]
MRRILLLVIGATVTLMVLAQYNMSPANVKMNMAMYAIKSLYVDEVEEDKLVESGIVAMMKALDPHSAYMTAEEIKEMNEPLQGGFDGIGISFNMLNDTLFVVEVIAGGPSEKAGLLPGDRIIFVDGETIAGVTMPNKDVMKRLKGPKGTKVKLDIKRRNQENLLSFTITRGKIPLYSLDAAFMLDKTTGYIKISRFGNTTADEFRDALEQLREEGLKDLVLDLQSNGGGLMNAAIELGDEFLPDGKSIVYTEGKNSPRVHYNATSKGNFEEGGLIVLIDEYSASASEIVSGAIQDWDRGLVIGRRSFGKGLVQRPIPLPDGSALKLTVSRYFTPSGRFIQKPYENGEGDQYSTDLIERYNRGEMLHADSIHFPDSLKTKTLVNGRTIYGGGGIMPDVFIAVDTTRFTSMHRKLAATGLLNRFSLEYVDMHRQELLKEYPDIDSFIQKHRVTEDQLTALMALAKQEKLELSKEETEAPQEMLKKQLMAFMARDLWKTADYYRVMYTENEALVRAIEIIKDKETYHRLLK